MDNQICLSPVTKQNKMKFNNNQLVSIYDLHEELLAEIFKRLPVKSIYHCMFVQKAWYSLIKTPIFITLHLNHQKISTHDHPKYLLFRNNYVGTFTVRLDDVQCEEYCTIKKLSHLPDYGFWYASSYGLMCVSTMFYGGGYDPNIYLWNPLIQKSKTLPDSPLPRFIFKEKEWQALAFGFVPDVNDYVVVHIVKLDSSSEPDPHSVMIGVYSLNTNTWKKKTQDNVFIDDISEYDVVFANGAAYWIGLNLDNHTIVMCFDTKTDILRQIRLPENWVEDAFYSPTIHPFGQSIAFFFEEQFYPLHMYVLKNDPINGISWEKKMSFNSSQYTRREALGVRNNGEPIFENFYNLISYDLENHETYNFVDSWDRWNPFLSEKGGPAPTFQISPFIESLVLLDMDGNN